MHAPPCSNSWLGCFSGTCIVALTVFMVYALKIQSLLIQAAGPQACKTERRKGGCLLDAASCLQC